MTTPDPELAFRAAVDRCVLAAARLHGDRSLSAFAEWAQAIEEVKRLHEPVAIRAAKRKAGGK